MRDDYEQFKSRGAEVVCIAPHDLSETRQLVESLRLPFPVLADGERKVFQAYDVASRAWSLGQRPGLYVLDFRGIIRFAHVGWQQWDIPSNRQVLDVLDSLDPQASADIPL